MQWNPQQYSRFSDARRQPFVDLLALIERAPKLRVVDLGSGPGNVTRELADALPESDVLGLDSSASMLTTAAALKRPGLRFAQQTIEDFAAGHGADFDLVFSNAALQWVPDHERLIPALWARLRPGGQLAVQLPANDDNPMRLICAEVAGWRYQLATLPLHAYSELLFRLGAPEQTVYEKVYPHVLADADAVLDWARGTTLLPYFARLPPADWPRFVDEVRRRLQLQYTQRPVFFPFRRIIFHARRA